MPTRLKPASGVGMVAALFVLVVLSVLGASIARLGWTQRISFVQDLDGARAQRAANSGAEWGLYQALRGGWTSCNGNTQTLTGTKADLGVIVTVSCSHDAHVEGQNGVGDPPVFSDRTVKVYRIDAVACNGATVCPDPDAARIASPGYVERRRQVHATDQ
jgi:MSHA biogenesis protein MshP